MTTFELNGKTFTQTHGAVTTGIPNPWEESGCDTITCDEPMTDADLRAIEKHLHMFPVVDVVVGGLSEDGKKAYASLTYDNCD